MARIWLNGFGFATAIAVVQTLIVWRIALSGVGVNLAAIAGLFAMFFATVTAICYFSFTQLRVILARQRKEKLAPGAVEPVAKESVILRLAPEWGLSQAEADVAIFVAKGFSNSEIADMRGCAIATVKSQLSRIYHKSGLESRYQLIGFVTDEVCAMANEPEKENAKLVTKNVLPLAGRTKSAA